MNSILSIGSNPIARLLALAIVLYSLGVIPLPKLGWSPCRQWFPVSVYVLTPGAGGMCYVMDAAGIWQVAVP
jgi:hypothetical protein